MLELPTISVCSYSMVCAQMPYCDFNSHRMPDTLPEQAYVTALINDLNQDLEWVQGRKIQSIFIGGGTPTIFS